MFWKEKLEMGGVLLNSLQNFDRILSVLYFSLNLC